MIPSRRLVVLAWLCALVAVAAGFSESARPALVALDGVVVVATLLDVLLVGGAAGRRRGRVVVTRSTAAILSVGRANVVTLTLRNMGRGSLRGVVSDDPLAHTEVQGLPATLDLPAQATAVVRYEITPTRRGPRRFGAVSVRYASPLGLVFRQERVDLPDEIHVYPDVHAARSLEMLRRQGRTDVRLGSLRVRGGDTEFERLRPYAVGDEVRHVDWRSSARRGDLTVRQFQADSNQNVILALDVGLAMRGESGGLTAIDHALNAALLTADVALRGGDKAGFLAFDGTPKVFLPPTGGRAGGRKLTRAIYDLDASLDATDFRGALAFLQTHVKTRSLVVVMTSLLSPQGTRDLAAAMKGLLPRHVPLCVVLRDTDIEDLVTEPARREEDLYVRAAAAETLAAQGSLFRALKRAGVLVLDTRPGDLTPALVNRYLQIKAQRLL